MTKEEILGLTKPESFVVHVDAWGADVTVRPLTLSEYMKTHGKVMSGDATVDAMMDAQIRSVAAAMVDPKISEEELRAIDVNRIDGIVQIYEAITKKEEEIPKG